MKEQGKQNHAVSENIPQNGKEIFAQKMYKIRNLFIL